MNNRKINRFILYLLAAGILLTLFTNYSVDRARTARAESLAESRTAESTVTAEQNATAAVPESRTGGSDSYADFLKKFRDMDASIRQMKEESKKDSSGVAEKNAAAAEQKYWETQLTALYTVIIGKLPAEEAAALAKDEQEWQKKKDDDAAEAAGKAAGTAGESLAYTISESESLRNRAYELLEKYKTDL